LTVAVRVERRNVWAHMRRREEHSSPVVERIASERHALREALDAVIPGGDDV
jgi:hypothetical protein